MTYSGCYWDKGFVFTEKKSNPKVIKLHLQNVILPRLEPI